MMTAPDGINGDKEIWKGVVSRGINEDNSWNASAKKICGALRKSCSQEKLTAYPRSAPQTKAENPK